MATGRIASIRKAKPALELHVAYGETECAPRATALDPRRIDQKPDSVGSPIPGVKVLIVDEMGNEVPAGQCGEVIVCGDNVMVGYWRQPEATARVIDPLCPLPTSDLGCVGQGGGLFLPGRPPARHEPAAPRS